MDGPITANNPWRPPRVGRTLKDVFPALQGPPRIERYQNGFDCQGLHVEVDREVARPQLEAQIEEYGLAEFAARCKERVAHFSGVIASVQAPRHCDGLGQLLLHLQRHEHRDICASEGVHGAAGCSRASLDAMVPALRDVPLQARAGGEGELRRAEAPVAVRAVPAKGSDDESLVVWTTTPWTLPANVAAAVKPDAEYGAHAEGLWYRVEEKLDPDEYVAKARGMSSSVSSTKALRLPAGARSVVHRVIPWDEVALDEERESSTSRRVPGRGLRALARADLPVLMPIDESGACCRVRRARGLGRRAPSRSR